MQADDPYRLAEIVLKNFTHPAGYTLRWYKQQFWCWIGRKYIHWSDEQIKADVNRDVEQEFMRIYQEKLANAKPDQPAPVKAKVSNALVSNVIAAIKSLTIVPDFVEAPCWIKGTYEDDESPSFVSVENGIIDVRMMDENGAPTLIPHTPLYFSFTSLPMIYDPDARCPKWMKFLEVNLQGNHDAVDMICQWFGYCLVPDTSRQKFLMMIGEGGNGKSVICAALTALLGVKSVSFVPLESFGERFAMNETVGKLANIAADMGEIDRVAEGRLKSFTSGDMMMIDRKGIAPISVQPTARLVFATNNSPRFTDRSSGLWRRMLLLELTYKVPDRDRVFGMDRWQYWEPEGSGILNWALMGLADLMRYGRFTEPEQSKNLINEFRSDGNPCRDFLEERYEFTGATHDWVDSGRAYEDYRKWCEQHGNQPMNSRNLGKEVFRIWKDTKKTKRKWKASEEKSGTFWVWQGIKERQEFAESNFDVTDF